MRERWLGALRGAAAGRRAAGGACRCTSATTGCSAASTSPRPCRPGGRSRSAACWPRPTAACCCWRWPSGSAPARRRGSPRCSTRGAVRRRARRHSTLRAPSRFGVVALDEGVDDDERTPRGAARPAGVPRRRSTPSANGRRWTRPTRLARDARRHRGGARARCPQVRCAATTIVEALCAAALALGIGSLRAPLLALRAARAAAALAGRRRRSTRRRARSAAAARARRRARRVLPVPPAADERWMRPHRTTRRAPPRRPSVPTTSDADSSAVASDTDPPTPTTSPNTDAARDPAAPLDDGRARRRASRPSRPACWRRLQLAGDARRARAAVGRPGALNAIAAARPADRRAPRRAARRRAAGPDRDLRAAAPWQRVRRARGAAPAGRRRRASQVRREDFRITPLPAAQRDHDGLRRRRLRLVRAAPAGRGQGRGRAAAGRLLRAPRQRGGDRLSRPRAPSCCCRRRARWCAPSAAWPACPAAAARRWPPASMRRAALADAVRRRGDDAGRRAADRRPRQHRARRHAGPRRAPHADALAAARRLRAARRRALLLDTSPQPQAPAAARWPQAMGARYLPLPHAGARRCRARARGRDADRCAGQPAARSAARGVR